MGVAQAFEPVVDKMEMWALRSQQFFNGLNPKDFGSLTWDI